SDASLCGSRPAAILNSMRESSDKEKTRLPGDTYEEWLGTQTEHRGKAKNRETNTPTSCDVWIEKLVQIEIRQSRGEGKRSHCVSKSIAIAELLC
ncbi:MAG TPA: hypothetical protein VGR53_08195, partial [Nitrososphaerales archaeon]|nr:hypothetical protein [Nitrososphaerales archaeon]